MDKKDMKAKVAKVAVISALALSTSLCGCTSKEFKEFQTLLENGEYVEAANYYSKNKEEIADENLAEVVKLTADAIYDSYTSGRSMSDDALMDLSVLLAIDAEGVEDYINEKCNLITSNENYEKADSYFSEANYLSAIEYYKKVIENDSNYSTAQNKISQAEELYKEELFAEADDYASNGNYESAISYLEDYLDKFSDSSDLQNKIDEYLNNILDEKLADANAYIKNGDYYSALEEIHTLLEAYPDSTKLADLQESTEKSYLDDLLPLIDDYVEKENYSDAYSVCETALEIMPDSEELNKRMETIEPLKPVFLSEMKISESAYFEQLTERTTTYEDVVGNTYNPGNLFRLHLSNDGWGTTEYGYAKVYLNAQYSTLTGTVVMDDISETGECVFTIYGDDKVLCKETFSRTSPPKEISVDVTGKKWIEIVISYPGEDSGDTVSSESSESSKSSDSDSSSASSSSTSSSSSSSSSSSNYTSELLLSGFGFSK